MTQLQTFDDTQKLIQKYGTRDPFELIDALPNTKLWPARSLDADGLRGFATIVNRVRYIAVNPHLPYEEQRVIAGHELGHIFEHSNHLRCQAMQDFDIYQATGRLEREANFFVQVVRGDAEGGVSANLTRIRAAEGAHVVLVQVQLLGNRARRWNAVAIEQGTSARVEQVRIELGGSVVACGARTLLNHNKCEYDLDAVYFGHSNDVLDFNDVSVHTGRDTLCEMHTAGVLTGSADKILRGTVDFQRGAKRGVGHESEDVLLFSPSARNRTAPLILCGEEEVEGQHAASVGRLDENKLYYLRSRGLSEAQARRLMVDARFAPAIDKIPLDSLQDEVRENVARRLNDELDG